MTGDVGKFKLRYLDSRYTILENDGYQIMAFDSYLGEGRDYGGLYLWYFSYGGEHNYLGMDIDKNSNQLKIIGVDIV